MLLNITDKHDAFKEIMPGTVLLLDDTSNVHYVQKELQAINPDVIFYKSISEIDFFDVIYISARNYFDGVGDTLFAQLESAKQKAKYIFIDKSFAVDEVNLSITYFTKKYRGFIEYSITFPTGEIMIKTSSNEIIDGALSKSDKDHNFLKNTYTAEYYLTDCGGYDSFISHKGSQLIYRLATVYQLLNIKAGERILDIGCGRGELAHYIYKYTNASVVGLDYSIDAIHIANETFPNIDKERLQYIQADILEYKPSSKFNKIALADVIEHLDQESLEKMFRQISKKLLTKDGTLVGHTAPNKLHYEVDYEKRRVFAQQAGTYLPKNPRTIYEDITHINEQTEESLHRALSKSFKHVYTWVPVDNHFFGNLLNTDLALDSTKGNSIYCIASNKPIDINDFCNNFKQERIEGLKQGDVKITSEILRLQVEPGEETKVDISIKNNSESSFKSHWPNPVVISYHIDDISGGNVDYNGLRTYLPNILYPGDSINTGCAVRAPDNPGEYVLKITLVQEDCFWFEDLLGDIMLSLPLHVRMP